MRETDWPEADCALFRRWPSCFLFGRALCVPIGQDQFRVTEKQKELIGMSRGRKQARQRLENRIVRSVDDRRDPWSDSRQGGGGLLGI